MPLVMLHPYFTLGNKMKKSTFLKALTLLLAGPSDKFLEVAA